MSSIFHKVILSISGLIPYTGLVSMPFTVPINIYKVGHSSFLITYRKYPAQRTPSSHITALTHLWMPHRGFSKPQTQTPTDRILPPKCSTNFLHTMNHLANSKSTLHPPDQQTSPHPYSHETQPSLHPFLAPSPLLLHLHLQKI